MAFYGWARCCEITIDHTKVPGDLVNFPIVLTQANTPSEMYDADGPYPARADGGDIRVTSDSAGDTQLPVEVYYFLRDNDPANGKSEIHVKVTSLSSSVDTKIYIWYAAPSETMPTRTSTYGSDNVWNANYRFVCHNGATINDSTSYALAGTNYSTTDDATNTLIGVSARKFVSASSQYIDYGNNVNINGNVAITVEAAVKFYTNAAVFQCVFGRCDTQYILTKHSATSIVHFQIYDTTWQMAYITTMVAGTWYNFAGRRTVSGGLVELVVNGTPAVVTDTSTTISSSANYLQTGRNYSSPTGRYLDGWVEETRISDSTRSN